MRFVLVSGLAALATLIASHPQIAWGRIPPSVTPLERPQASLLLFHRNYQISVSGSGRKVELTAGREDFTKATYVARGKASPNRIRARFGRFGLVSMRFKPSRVIRRDQPPGRCKGRPAIERWGIFVGTIRFHGEEGYIDVRSHRAVGVSITHPRWKCPSDKAARASARQSPPREKAELMAFTSGKQVSLLAIGVRDWDQSSFVVFVVIAKERRGSVRIERSGLVLSSRGKAFSYEESGRMATLRPPRPFHGTAIFDRSAPAPEQWGGTLSVNLPGATMPLTGPQFRANLKIEADHKI